MNQAVLLDLDGTLADSRPGIIACFRHMLAELGHDPAEAGDLTWAVGPPMAVSVGTLLAKYGDDRLDLGLATYRARYSAVAIYDCTVFPGVMAMLAALKDAGRTLCLATSKRRDFAERVVDYLELRQYVPKVYGALPGGGLDDKKDLLAEILRAEGFDAANTTMVGDRLHDIHAAQANNIRSIGVLWGYGGQAELQEAGANILAETPDDVLHLL
ncbi:HAD hydrolase-like protein [Acidisphaera sp. S103]|uniref:HAD hydrolase-like protein n=1 Tax=Acidisphaera sp. S103 TaxID=1747223 RepID=UPI00131A96EA|nr:HAD hydrolase-like protein [Acidisphaera sp. S103]